MSPVLIPALIGPLGPVEVLIILFVGLLIFGARLPEVGRSLGKGLVEFKRGLRGVQDEVTSIDRESDHIVDDELQRREVEHALDSEPDHDHDHDEHGGYEDLDADDPGHSEDAPAEDEVTAPETSPGEEEPAGGAPGADADAAPPEPAVKGPEVPSPPETKNPPGPAS